MAKKLYLLTLKMTIFLGCIVTAIIMELILMGVRQ